MNKTPRGRLKRKQSVVSPWYFFFFYVDFRFSLDMTLPACVGGSQPSGRRHRSHQVAFALHVRTTAGTAVEMFLPEPN